MSEFAKGDRVRVNGGGSHLEGRIATVLRQRGGQTGERVRIKVNVKMPEIEPDWEHDYWSVEEKHLTLVDAVTELGELA